jgi:hypothetical protein
MLMQIIAEKENGCYDFLEVILVIPSRQMFNLLKRSLEDML